MLTFDNAVTTLDINHTWSTHLSQEQELQEKIFCHKTITAPSLWQ
jgi:hypothetical protein